MDGSEIIRRAALRLHNCVADDEADQLNSVALVEAAAAHLDLELVQLEKRGSSSEERQSGIR